MPSGQLSDAQMQQFMALPADQRQNFMNNIVSSGNYSPNQTYQQPAQNTNTNTYHTNSTPTQTQPAQTNANDPYQNILYSKNQWDTGNSTGNDGLKTWAANNATQYYNMLPESERATVSDMTPAQLQAYIATKSQQQPQGQPTPTGQPQGQPQTQAGMTAEQIQALINGSLGGWQTNFNNMLQQVTNSTAGNKQYTDQMFSQFQELMNAMNNKNDAKWAQEKEYADTQAKKIADEQKAQFGDLITKLTGNQKGELEALQNSFTDAQAGLEDKTFQNYLQSRQNIVNSGMQDSGIAEDANTRLMLSRGKELAGLSRQTQQQMGQVQNNYSDKLSEAQRALAGVNQSDIAAKQFQDLYKSGSDQMTEQAKLFAQMFQSSLPYSAMKPGDVLNASTDWMNQNSQDFWKNQDNAFKEKELVEKSNQFYDKLDIDTQQFNSTQKLEMAKVAQQAEQYYDKLDQDNYWKDQDNQMEYLKTMLPYQQLTQDEQAKYSYYYDKMDADLRNTQIDAQARVQVAASSAAAKVASAQAAASAKIAIEQNKAMDARKIPSDADIQVFLDNLAPGSDTRESVKKDLNSMLSAGQISSEGYLTYQKISDSVFTDFEKNKAEITAKNKEVWKAVPGKVSDAVTQGWNNVLPPGTGDFFKKMFTSFKPGTLGTNVPDGS